MALIAVLNLVLLLFWLLLISRVIVEFIHVFARDWHPSGFLAVIFEVIFTITDPPVKLLRRLIPPVNLGGIRLDLSIMVLLFVVFFLYSLTATGGTA
ncbi:YggT family protein [Nocardia sp. CC227C]|uniref:YggT family protein n=1 Tax=Nocardia sp. CC227C TaxID=3044562 RepID=UPI00278BFF52|nr:YggT family protein [Nocardia sp. CC227C]